MARRQVLAGTHKPIAANELRIATVEAAAAAASDDDEPGPNPAIFAWLSVNCCKPEATVQSIESTSVIRPRLKRHPQTSSRQLLGKRLAVTKAKGEAHSRQRSRRR